jgi:lipopolysaccharide export system permease protein
MRGLMLRHLLRRYLVLVGAVLAGVLVVFLVADFVDRARAYTGPNWIRDVAELYGWKAVVAAHQLAPAALLLASATLVSLLRRRGELTAILALGFGRRVLFAPVAGVALVAAVGLGLLDEFVVGHASRRVDEITALRFHRWGDWRSYFDRKQWFRHQDRILHLEGGDVESGFRGVTVLRLTPEFDLAERVDAQAMEHAGGTRWRLVGVTRRTFERGGALHLTQLPEETVDLGMTRALLGIRPGRPEQMRLRVLRQQIRARREVGLSDRLFVLALGNRFTYPLAGVPAALVALALALRPGRGSASLTGALVEGLAVTMGLWGLTVIARALVNAGRMEPLVAAALPIVVLTVALAALLWVPPGAGRRLVRRGGWSGARA